MTGDGPVWGGSGTDPWLPARLAAQAEFAEGEQIIYRDFWARLSSWLVRLARAVLGGVRPDPHAVWALAPLWVTQMAEFTNGPVLQVMGRAYTAVFGPGWRFDSRPAVAAHLAGVRNRMVRTPDAVFDLVATEVADGSARGESIQELAERVEQVLSVTATDRWPNRAVVVARTETLGALNAGRADAFTALADELVELDPDGDATFEDMWLATDDERTRPTHREADGQRVPLGTPFTVGGHSLLFPGDPAGPAQEIIQCLVDPDAPILTARGWRPIVSIRPGDRVVTHRGRLRPVLRLAAERFHSGDVIRIETAAGVLRVTPNHPVLTAEGWVVAGELRPGMIVFRATPVQQRHRLVGGGLRGVNPVVGGAPPAPRLRGKGQQHIRLPRFDHEVRPHRAAELRRLESSQLPPEHHRPVGPLRRGIAVDHPHAGGLSQEPDQPLVAVGHHEARLVLEFPPGHVDALASPAPSADGNHTLAVDQGRNVGRGYGVHSTMVPEYVMTFSREAVHDARLYNFAVAEDESYIAGGIAVHNCRCTHLLVRPGETVDLSNRQFRTG